MGSKKLEMFLTIWQSPGFSRNSFMIPQLFSSTFCFWMLFGLLSVITNSVTNKYYLQKSPKINQNSHIWQDLQISYTLENKNGFIENCTTLTLISIKRERRRGVLCSPCCHFPYSCHPCWRGWYVFIQAQYVICISFW